MALAPTSVAPGLGTSLFPPHRNPECGTMSDEEPVCEIHKDDNDDVFILIDGMKIAKRGLPDTAHAMTWIMLEPGWIVRDVDHGNAIEVRFEGH